MVKPCVPEALRLCIQSLLAAANVMLQEVHWMPNRLQKDENIKSEPARKLLTVAFIADNCCQILSFLWYTYASIVVHGHQGGTFTNDVITDIIFVSI